MAGMAGMAGAVPHWIRSLHLGHCCKLGLGARLQSIGMGTKPLYDPVQGSCWLMHRLSECLQNPFAPITKMSMKTVHIKEVLGDEVHSSSLVCWTSYTEETNENNCPV